VIGFVLAGSGARNVLIRAIGSSSAPSGAVASSVDPRIQLFGPATLIAENDNWGGGPALADAFTQAGAFLLDPRSKDAALVARLLPGSYTVVVAGAGNSTGPALVEIYDLDP